jgi:hypothetical protein
MQRRVVRWIALAAALLSPPLPGWQLTPRALDERVADASVIVVAAVAETYSRKASPIAGIGDVWDVRLRVVETLKGRLPEDARVTFTDVAVEDRAAFRPVEPRLWLLGGAAKSSVFAASSGYESVLRAEQAPAVRQILDRARR